jgi:hypothetical protein
VWLDLKESKIERMPSGKFKRFMHLALTLCKNSTRIPRSKKMKRVLKCLGSTIKVLLKIFQRLIEGMVIM